MRSCRVNIPPCPTLTTEPKNRWRTNPRPTSEPTAERAWPGFVDRLGTTVGAERLEIAISDGAVDLWLDRRFPFEPKGDLLTFRTQVREAIRSLRCSPGSVLCATYSSVDESVCDVENVLIYNIGPSVFADSSRRGLRLVRSWTAPSASPLGRRYRHHHRYCFTDPPRRPTAPGATEFSFALTSLSTSTKLHEVWWRATAASRSAVIPITGRFSLHVELGASDRVHNVANIVKPLLDGIVCAMHAERQIDVEAVERLARATAWDTVEIRKRLSAPPNPILGSRRLLNVYRDFVKWDPADDRCDDCTVLLTEASKLTCRVVVVPSAAMKSAREVRIGLPAS